MGQTWTMWRNADTTQYSFKYLSFMSLGEVTLNWNFHLRENLENLFKHAKCFGPAY